MLDHTQALPHRHPRHRHRGGDGEIGEQTGVTWASVQDRPMSVWLPGTGNVVVLQLVRDVLHRGARCTSS